MLEKFFHTKPHILLAENTLYLNSTFRYMTELIPEMFKLPFKVFFLKIYV